MDLLPPTAPSLVFARETCTPYWTKYRHFWQTTPTQSDRKLTADGLTGETGTEHHAPYAVRIQSVNSEFSQPIQSALHFTSLTDLFTQTPARPLWEASSHMLQLMREGCSYTYPPLSIARYSFIRLSEVEHCRVEKPAYKVLTPQYRIRTRVLVVESPKLYL